MEIQKRQTRQFRVILIIVFLGFLGISMPYLIFPALFLNPEYSILPADWSDSSRALFLGIALAAYPLGQFIGSPILGSLSDDYGRKKLLSGSMLLSAFCNLFTGFAIAWQNLTLLIISRLIAGIMEGNIAIARAMAADLKTIPKHHSFGKVNTVTSVAFILGPLLGGVMADKNLFEWLTVSTPFYFICIFFFCLTGLAMLVLDEGVINPCAKVLTFWQRINLIKRLSLLFSNKRLQFLMLISTCFTLAVDIFYEFSPVHLTLKWELGPSQLVFYNGIVCFSLAIGSGILPGFFSSRISNRLAVLLAMGALVLILIGIVLANSVFPMMLLFALSGLVIGLTTTLLTVKISDSVSETIQGEVMGVQMSLRVLGDAMICLLGGALLLFSSKLILMVAAGISMVTMACYALGQKSIPKIK